jgi:hypothetical protein
VRSSDTRAGQLEANVNACCMLFRRVTRPVVHRMSPLLLKFKHREQGIGSRAEMEGIWYRGE